MAFADQIAVVGLSRPRADNKAIAGLELGETLAAGIMSAPCCTMAIDLKSGDIEHWVNIQGIVQDLYDAALMPSVVRITTLGFKSDGIRRVITPDRSAS